VYLKLTNQSIQHYVKGFGIVISVGLLLLSLFSNFDNLKRISYKLRYWLRGQKNGYTKQSFERFSKSCFVLGLSLLLLYFVYVKRALLDRYELIFFKTGTLLFLVGCVFTLKLVWQFFRDFLRFIKTLKPWQILLILSVILLTWYFTVQTGTADRIFARTILPVFESLNISDFSPFISDKVKPIEELVSKLGADISASLPSDIFSPPSLTSNKTLEIELQILYYTNIQRKQYGLGTLIWDEKLAEVARDHSEDMANNSFFDHTNTRGEDPTDRALRHGYNVHKDLGGGWYSEGIAENIGKMPTGNVEGIGYVSSEASSIANAEVNSWMNSPGHRANILNAQYSVIGVGVAFDGHYYISTQNFK